MGPRLRGCAAVRSPVLAPKTEPQNWPSTPFCAWSRAGLGAWTPNRGANPLHPPTDGSTLTGILGSTILRPFARRRAASPTGDGQAAWWPMRLTYAFCADAAQIAPDGKLYVLGGDFEVIHAQEFPAKHPALFLVVKLSVQPPECQREHQLRVELIGPDGHAVTKPIVLSFKAEPNSLYPHKPIGVGLIINFQNLQFQKPGDYAFHVLVDDLELDTVPLVLAPRPLRGTDLERKTEGEK